MRRRRFAVPLAALLSAVFAASAAAQGTAPDAVVATVEPGARDGNPLSAIPLGDLVETRARPLFSSSRRPPAAPILAALPAPVDGTPRSKPGPDHPLLTLLGTIVGEAIEIGVFADEASHDVIRLKAGEVHDGWTLRSVSARAAIFDKQGSSAATLMLAPPGAEANAASGAAALLPQVIPAAAKGGASRLPHDG